MFQTTVWEVVEAAGARDARALEQIAEDYRQPILAFIRSRGVRGPEAEDLCHDVFVRVLSGGVIKKADAAKGRFRALLCTVTVRVIQDWARRHRDVAAPEVDATVPPPGFDRLWVLYLVERALARLKSANPRSYHVLRAHLAGESPDRNKLWIARGKLAALIRREIAVTCRTPEEVEAEIACLAPYLRPLKKNET